MNKNTYDVNRLDTLVRVVKLVEVLKQSPHLLFGGALWVAIILAVL